MINLPSAPKIIEQDENSASIEIEGLYPGYGVTLGSALRRVLLSSLSGAAITSFRIIGVEHEFSTVPSVLENVLDIMLNIKKIRLQVFGEGEQKLLLKVKGEQEVKASDIEPNSLIKIVNPDIRIATITDKKGSLEIEMTAEKGIGYSSAEERKQEKLPIGTIALDAIFSPIRKVNFTVENMRVGKRVDYNKLIIYVETDGTTSPIAAFKEATTILKNHFDSVDIWNQEQVPEIYVDTDKPKAKKETKEAKIEDLSFSGRTEKALIKNSIKTLAGLLRHSESSLSEMEGLGDKAIEEIKEKLNELGHSLKA